MLSRPTITHSRLGSSKYPTSDPERPSTSYRTASSTVICSCSPLVASTTSPLVVSSTSRNGTGVAAAVRSRIRSSRCAYPITHSRSGKGPPVCIRRRPSSGSGLAVGFVA